MILIAFSSRQLGFDPAVIELGQYLWRADYHTVLQDIDVTPKVDETEFEAVIVFDAFEWYFENRIRLQGRPWICAVSTCFDSLMPFMGVNSTDAGIDCYFTNCATFLAQVSQTSIAHFSYKPLAAPRFDAPFERLVGAVLPNAADRDFCLLARAYKHFQKIGDERHFRISLPATEKMQLPPIFPESVVIRSNNARDTARHLSLFSHMILCPRITDYRAGVLPEELLQAAHNNVPTLCLYHPALAAASKLIKPMASTLSEFDTMLSQISDDKSALKINAGEPVPPTAEQFASLILQAFERSKHAAT